MDIKVKLKPRDEDSKKSYKTRINRVVGQLNGINKMFDENRYCGDILTQLSAAKRAVEELSYLVLQDHIKTCVADELKEGKTEIVDETVALIRNLK